MSGQEFSEPECDYCTISLSPKAVERMMREQRRWLLNRAIVTVVVSAATTMVLLLVYSRWLG